VPTAPFTIKPSTRFKKDVRRLAKQGLVLSELAAVIDMLANHVQLPPSSHDHTLGGEYQSCRECHIRPDWLLIYEADGESLYLYLIRTGTHSDLFSR
jgi:mRNA interferase YafQ